MVCLEGTIYKSMLPTGLWKVALYQAPCSRSLNAARSMPCMGRRNSMLASNQEQLEGEKKKNTLPGLIRAVTTLLKSIHMTLLQNPTSRSKVKELFHSLASRV